MEWGENWKILAIIYIYIYMYILRVNHTSIVFLKNRNKNGYSHKNLYTNAHSITIYNSKETKATQMNKMAMQ